MKTMRERIFSRMKSIPQMQLKQGRILHLKASPTEVQPATASDGTAEPKQNIEEEEEGSEDSLKKRQRNNEQSSRIHRYRRPNLNSATLFDPNLLAAFEQAVEDYLRAYDLLKRQLEEEKKCPLKGFEEKCPPGGRGNMILYTTSLRGVRKTFEGCGAVRFLLESSGARFYERDVSMHTDFRDELRALLDPSVVPPRLFVDGRYIGGADDVIGLHERGMLMPLLEKMPRDRSCGEACRSCAGAKFTVCGHCDGGRKLYDGAAGVWGVCGLCNENGLTVCPACCCC